MTQFSLFGAAAAEPTLDDLAGILLAGGHWVVRQHGSANLSVVVDGPWRALALRDELTARGLGTGIGGTSTVPDPSADGPGDVPGPGDRPGDRPDPAPPGDGPGDHPDVPPPVRRSVQTGFTDRLSDQARRWIRGANEAPPGDLVLTPGGLRLWAIAAGRPDEAGYLLATARADDPMHLAAGAQLSRLGLAGVSISRGGPGWRITSRRRVRRLVELVGPAPRGADEQWPGAG